MNKFMILTIASAYASLIVACGALEQNSTDIISSPLTSTANVFYEGSCDFLLRCSGPSRAKGRVVFGCESRIPELKTTTCLDTVPYITAPTKDYCGMPVRICTSPANCITANVWDVSDATAWEANPAVMNALGQSYSDGDGVSCGSTRGTLAGASVSRGTVDYTDTDTWPPITLSRGMTYEVFFSPGLTGWHAIDFTNNSSAGTAGNLTLCWKSAASSWNCWKTVPISSSQAREKLWSGSRDISFKFVVAASKDAKFYFRRYTGWEP